MTDRAAPKLSYAYGELNRASDRRQDEDWIQRVLAAESTRFVLSWRYQHGVVRHDDGPRAVTFARREVEPWLEADDRRLPPLFLGLQRERAVFAVDLDPAVEPEPPQDRQEGLEYQDLRRIGPLLPADEASLFAFARGLVYWHRHHRFCSRCGRPTLFRQGGHLRVCSDEGCGKQTFPRTDPAVIMLVEHQPADGPPVCLLGRGSKWPPGSFSTLAGFVEPGESLEEAVAREVLEEAGVATHDIRYRGSQPWPFPSSLMLGFRARASSTELQLDPEELADAGWFTAERLEDFGEWLDKTSELRLPRKDSIARFLVDEWVAEQRG